MSLMPAGFNLPMGMQSMDLNALARMFSASNSTNPGRSTPDANRSYLGVTYDANHPYVTSGFIANSNREAKFKNDMAKLRQEASGASQSLLAANKNNSKYWSKHTGMPSGNISSLTGLLGTNAGLTPGRLQGGDQYFVDLLPYADRYNQLMQDYRAAGGTNRNYGQPGYY